MIYDSYLNINRSIDSVNEKIKYKLLLNLEKIGLSNTYVNDEEYAKSSLVIYYR